VSMSNKDMIKYLAQAQAADMLNNLQETFNAGRDKLAEIIQDIDITNFGHMIALTAFTAASAEDNKKLRLAIKKLKKQQARKNEYIPLTRKKAIQLENAILDAVGGHEVEIVGTSLQLLRATMAKTHIMDEKALVPSSVKRDLDRLRKKKHKDEEED